MVCRHQHTLLEGRNIFAWLQCIVSCHLCFSQLQAPAAALSGPIVKLLHSNNWQHDVCTRYEVLEPTNSRPRLAQRKASWCMAGQWGQEKQNSADIVWQARASSKVSGER